MRNLRNVAVVGLGVWAGEMAAGFVVPLLPKDSSGAVNPWVERAARYGVTAAVVLVALRTLGSKRKA